MVENIFSNLKYIAFKPSNDKIYYKKMYFKGQENTFPILKCILCECKMYLKKYIYI